MNKIIIIFLSFILIFFNTLLASEEKNKNLKIGLLAPFSGEYKNLGDSLLLSIQLALDEINDKNVIIVPRDSGSNDKEKLNQSIKEIINEEVKIIIGPIDSEDFEEVKKYEDIIFISPSNIYPEITDNIISIGISLDSQLDAIKDFLIKQKKNKTIILFPENQYSKFINSKIKKTNLNNYKIFKYNPDPKILTGEIEKLTNYSQRKRNLEIRKKNLLNKDDPASIQELKKLEQKYTLGKVNFDSVIIVDFGNGLKSVLTSLIFSDVSENDVLFTTVNQWFDESIFYENSLKALFYPSVNYKNFKRYNQNYINKFKVEPNEITILAYDALGLIYYIWKKKGKIVSVKDFYIKDRVKGKIGTFSFNEKKVFQELNIYKAENNKFTKF